MSLTDLHRDILATLDRWGTPVGPERLDRSLITRWDPDTVVLGLMPALKELIGAGLVSYAPGYAITDAGRQALAAAEAAEATA